MRILVACEFSGIVRNSFIKRGHDAVSCDLLPTESPGQHYKCSVFNIDNIEQFDIIIAHPPCTALCVSGNRHYAGTQARIDAAMFVKKYGICQLKKCA